MDDVELGGFPAQCERPEPLKFAWPIVVLPELFATPRHLATGVRLFRDDRMGGIRSGFAGGDRPRRSPPLGKIRFKKFVALAGEAIDAMGRDAIIVGHGVGGLVALKLAEHRRVKASVAIAPLAPGFRTPLVGGLANRLAMMWRLPIKPPRGRVLFELIADADPFTRDGLINAMVPDSGAIAADAVAGAIEFAAPDKAAPRLIVAGDSDIFAPLTDLAVCGVDRREAGDDRRPRALADWRARARTRDERDAAIPGARARPGFAAALSRRMEKRAGRLACGSKGRKWKSR